MCIRDRYYIRVRQLLRQLNDPPYTGETHKIRETPQTRQNAVSSNAATTSAKHSTQNLCQHCNSTLFFLSPTSIRHCMHMLLDLITNSLLVTSALHEEQILYFDMGSSRAKLCDLTRDCFVCLQTWGKQLPL
eukprot:TRINITY_DN9507_c0_g3_i5.p2 TRINITY_DN9507_c0_g3~~TRINITY_DN9507_c0_g3_i5.p2  ORF type:complete len:132 (-),score=5.17 TRINITY_DN9507_c0_g3_i5:305-700(-)